MSAWYEIESERFNQITMEDDMKLDKYHYHEAIDRSSVMTDYFNDYLKSHIVVQQDGELKLIADKIVSALYDFQNRIAAKYYYQKD